MKNINKCKVIWCNGSSLYKDRGHLGYCCRHYRQLQRCGRILRRTIRDKNEIIDCGSYYEVCLYNIKSEEIARTKIDKNDYKKIKNYKLGLDGDGYVKIKLPFSNKNIPLSHFIINKPINGFVIDHINHDVLNNRKNNLRMVSRSQNNMNKKIQKNNTSGVPGLLWNKINNNWNVNIKINKKRISIGTFENKQDAFNARKQAEQKYFGEFAYKENNN